MATPVRLSRVRLSSALAVAASLAALGAAADARIRLRRGSTLRVLVHDASASCGARATPDEDEIAALLDGLGSADRVAVLSFGAHVGLSVGQCSALELRSELARAASVAPAPDPHGSSLFAALLEAARRATRGPDAALEARRLEFVLATDGRATDGSETRLGNVVATLRDAGSVSMRVLRRLSVDACPVVAELRGPGAARVGEPFMLEARGVATRDETDVELRDDSGVIETRQVRGKGPFRVAFTRIEETTGPVSFSARIAGDAEIPPPVARVVVTSPGKALLIGADLHGVPGLDAEWRALRDLRLSEIAPLFGAHDVVVLDDVPSSALDGLDRELREFVERGGGVVLLGGAHSFGAGGWAGREIEKISPLVARPRDETGTFLYLALDGSGSMAEPWSDEAGAATRDAVVRSAATALVRCAGQDTRVALRQFAHGLLPPGVAAEVIPLASASAVGRAIEAMQPPGGPTALLPPLREAVTIAASRGEKRKAALILTDGRTPERASDLHEALVALDAAQVRVTFVLPGAGALDDEALPLRQALAGTKAVVRGATSPERLAEEFREIEEKARVDETVVENRRLRLDDAMDLVAADALPGSAARVDRVWLAEGARRLVVTDRGEPVAALRRVGLGAVAALATRPGDPDWLAADPATARLVASLARAVARPASGRVRVERDGATRLLVAYETPPGADAPVFARSDREHGDRVPLVPGDGGLLACEVGARAAWVDLVAAAGRVLATVGLDTPAPAEYRDPQPVDLDALAALACRDTDVPTAPLAPWLAACAVALALASVAAARIKSAGASAR
jgi:hypothetical protein